MHTVASPPTNRDCSESSAREKKPKRPIVTEARTSVGIGKEKEK